MEETKQTPAMVRKEADRPTREIRASFGMARAKLDIPYSIPGYHLHWINDTPGRIAYAESVGYAFVTQDEVRLTERTLSGSLGTNVSRLVGKQEDGVTPMQAYLMKIRQDWYDEDQRALQGKIDKVDDAIRGGNIEGHVGEHGRYIPKGGIKLDT
ncbi:MAG: hypothetical protein KGL39_09985 [Patescibacteria group bacterium]|nr:hypothetical protein [Patescibacteria group bacterium]